MGSETQAADRIYYDDSGATEFTAEVTAIREVARVDGRQVWQVALDRTAFYPTSGGQPFDTGTLTAISRSGASLVAEITAVEEDDAGEVWHTTAKPLQEGTAVQGAVSVERRRDHMQQHSGQHLLSAVLLRQTGAKTLSFHLGAELSTIDLDLSQLSEDELRQAEGAANAAIRQALPMTTRWVGRAEAEALLAGGLLQKLPLRNGDLRLVEIPGLDLNACGGTHVSSTAAIGPLLLRGTERMRGGVRLGFVCGERAVSAARADHALLNGLAESLSTGPAELPAGIARLQAEVRSAARERAALLEALAAAEADRLAAAARAAGSRFVSHTLEAGHAGRDGAFAKSVAVRCLAEGGLAAALIVAPEPATPGAAQGERASVVLATGGVPDAASVLRPALAAAGGRGGGNRELAQGSVAAGEVAAFLHSVGLQLAAME